MVIIGPPMLKLYVPYDITFKEHLELYLTAVKTRNFCLADWTLVNCDGLFAQVHCGKVYKTDVNRICQSV